MLAWMCFAVTIIMIITSKCKLSLYSGIFCKTTELKRLCSVVTLIKGFSKSVVGGGGGRRSAYCTSYRLLPWSASALLLSSSLKELPKNRLGHMLTSLRRNAANHYHFRILFFRTFQDILRKILRIHLLYTSNH